MTSDIRPSVLSLFLAPLFAVMLFSAGAQLEPSPPEAAAVLAIISAPELPPAVELPTPDDPHAFVGSAYDAVYHRNWRILCALGLIVVVWAGRRYGGKAWPWLQTDRGGAALAFGLAALGGAIQFLSTPELRWQWSFLLDWLVAGATAIGLFSGGKRLIAPPDKQDAKA